MGSTHHRRSVDSVSDVSSKCSWGNRSGCGVSTGIGEFSVSASPREERSSRVECISVQAGPTGVEASVTDRRRKRSGQSLRQSCTPGKSLRRTVPSLRKTPARKKTEDGRDAPAALSPVFGKQPTSLPRSLHGRLWRRRCPGVRVPRWVHPKIKFTIDGKKVPHPRAAVNDPRNF